MKRFWQYSVAMVLGVASFTTVMGQQPRVAAPAPPVAPPRPAPAAPVNGGGVALPNPRPIVNAIRQGQQGAPNGVLQAQGVNRLPGQGAVNQQNPQPDFPGAAPVNRENQLDQFGANLQQANRVNGVNNNNQQIGNQQPSDNRPSMSGVDQLFGSGPAFVSSSVTSSGYGEASTIEEGAWTGRGSYLQGAGEYNRNTAEALKTLEQARALRQINAENGLKTYFELKRINAAYRAETGPIPVSKEKLDQWNREDQPVRLTKREYNSDSGRVQWPSVLMTPIFDSHRLELEAAFARRTANEFGVSSDFYRIVKHDSTAMQNLLKAYLKSEEKFFSDQEYMAAKNFLDSLTQEARLAPDLDGLVAN